jgi:CRISPR type IV-associated protein Csf1
MTATTSEYVYPSAFVRAAIGIPAESSQESPIKTNCMMCAAPIKKGDGCTPACNTTFNKSFGNHPDIGARDSQYVCEDCLPLWNPTYLQKYSKSLVTRDGMFKLSSNVEQASFLLSPPKNQPFMVFLANTKQQHLIWRTPINYSPERFTIRLGTQLLVIRHTYLIRAVSAQRNLLATYRLRVDKKMAANSVFLMGDRNMKSLGFILDEKFAAMARDFDLTDELKAIDVLTVGERWALSIIGFSLLENPVELEKVMPI